MSIENNFLHSQSKLASGGESLKVWIYEHPTLTKVARIAGLILGLGLLASLPFTAPLFGIGISVSLALTGIVLTVASAVTLLALDIIISPHHDMKNHLFKPGQCEGGKLYYEGDVPILSLTSDNPFQAGRAHGYLCGPAINQLAKRLNFVLHGLAKRPRADQLSRTLLEIRSVTPKEYLREIEGLVDGYNQWVKEQHFWQFAKTITVDDVLLLHLLPDSVHFQPGLFERRGAARIQNNIAFACSSIVNREPQKGLTFARNMDWPSFGLAGSYSLIIHRKRENGLHSTVEVGLPCFVGTLTGMNDKGLSLAMNVCCGSTQSIRGMPASFYNRACLEKCQTVQEVDEFTQKQAPLGDYHMTVVDPEKAESIHFYQSTNMKNAIHRRWQEGRPLATFNYRYDPEPNVPMHHSNERQKVVDAFFQQRNNRPLEEALALPYVNNWLTTHRVVMEPKTRTFKVAFDNAFAGKRNLHAVPTQKLFG
jgi:Acyl-coenzyme A:6-aminopenicillanic acid acyl-transferase